MRHRLLKFWAVLWQTFGIRPWDVDHMTIGEVLAVEHYCAEQLKAR